MAVAEVGAKEASSKAKQASAGALLFELETIGFDGRKLAFDVLKTLLQKEGVKLSESEFIRYGQHPAPKALIHWAAGSWPLKNTIADKLVEDFADKFAEKLLNDAGSIKAPLAKLIQSAFDKNMDVGVVSSLPEEAATKILAKLGLDEKGVKLFWFKGEGRNFPGADMWLKVAKQLNRHPKTCLVLASSGNASRAALSAGMKCIGLPDSFTQHHDFGGADAVYESWDDVNAKEVLSIVLTDTK